MNKTTIYSTIIASAIAVLAVFVVSSSEVEAKPPSSAICPEENVQHWNKIMFQVGGTVFTHPTLPDLGGGSKQEMIVQVDPNDINEPLLLVAKKLNANGYLQGGLPVDPNNAISGLPLDIEYSTICAEN